MMIEQIKLMNSTTLKYKILVDNLNYYYIFGEILLQSVKRIIGR